MNTENIKKQLSSARLRANNAIIVEALMAVRHAYLDNRDFVAQVIWTIFSKYQKFSESRISEKQAYVIAKYIATIPASSLMNNLTREQFEALGYELPAEEAKEVPAKTIETLKSMSCDHPEVAKIIAEVIETGKATKSQAVAISEYIAYHKGGETEKAEEQTEEVKERASRVHIVSV